jgi:hypothetical protein
MSECEWRGSFLLPVGRTQTIRGPVTVFMASMLPLSLMILYRVIYMIRIGIAFYREVYNDLKRKNYFHHSSTSPKSTVMDDRWRTCEHGHETVPKRPVVLKARSLEGRT